MTSASSLAFPGSRTLASWWRQLEHIAPVSLSVGYLFVHRLDVPARWLIPRPVDPLLLLVLEALALDQDASGSAGLDQLAQRLRLDAPVIRGLIKSLLEARLVEPCCNGAARPRWALSQEGRQALQKKTTHEPHWRRAQLAFVERLGPAGQRLADPHFLSLREAPSTPWHVEAGAAFDMKWLEACLVQSDEWKATFGFPADLAAFLTGTAISQGASLSLEAAAPAALPAWERVALDRSERLLVALCRVAQPEGAVLGFGVRPEGWALAAAEPVIHLPAAGRSILSDLDTVADAPSWRQTWRQWCQSRTQLGASEEQCELTVDKATLRVRIPAPLLDALRTSKSDLLKGDTWLLAGEGYLRHAARLELE